ncbi:7629cc16-e119-4c6d-ba20-34e31b1c0392 [Sclerotinia trifoliorum]|uniref:7629cc16-e119-4c6d-ba20-34e31b1c0392 n=1 Tax=Sclerotinia trifoliorum TaxID=28548 RepID=A0A8H2VYI2_9HELO|nr:7629cc16-e119-4c6d-ba20-34e31b1c0392 [Sclerotinia trifoliorum]
MEESSSTILRSKISREEFLKNFLPACGMPFISPPSEEVNDETSPAKSKDIERPVNEQVSGMITLESKSPCYWKTEDSIYTSVPLSYLETISILRSIITDGDDCVQLDCTKNHVSPICPDALLDGVFDLKRQSGHYFKRFIHPQNSEIQQNQEVLVIPQLRHIYIHRMKHLQLPRDVCPTSVLLPSEDSPSEIMRQVQSAKALLDIVWHLKCLVFSRTFGDIQNELKLGVLPALLFRYPALMTDKQRYLFGTGERRIKTIADALSLLEDAHFQLNFDETIHYLEDAKRTEICLDRAARDFAKKLNVKAKKQHKIPVTDNNSPMDLHLLNHSKAELERSGNLPILKLKNSAKKHKSKEI